MRASIAAAALALSLSQTAVAGPIEKRYDAYLTVSTEDAGLTWCNPYADFVAPLTAITNFYEPTKVNATCWTETTMKDSKGLQNGNPTWLRLSLPGTPSTCWITEEFLQAGNLDFQARLKRCTAPQHQIGMPTEKYVTGDAQFKCYKTTSTTGEVVLLPFSYTDLKCWTTGESVNGSTKWAKTVTEGCYIPNDVFDPKEFHGNSGGNC